MKKLAIIFSLVLIFCFTVYADDSENEEWDLGSELQQLYEDGLVSDDLMEDYENGTLLIENVPGHENTNDNRDSDLVKSDSSSVMEKQVEDQKVTELSSGNSEGSSDGPILRSNVPVSGSAYSDPTLVGVDYAPNAAAGSLLDALYTILGKPVQAYHYQWISNSQNQTRVYSVEVLDYDINWICSVVLLFLVIFCIFRAGGALLKR